MELWASHVLAQGAGTSDVVRDMWKLSWVYPAQPSLGLPGGARAGITAGSQLKTCIQANKHRDSLCVYMSICVCIFVIFWLWVCRHVCLSLYFGFEEHKPNTQSRKIY